MLGDSVPKVKRTVRASSTKGTMLRMEGDGIDGIDVCHVILRGVAMAFE